MAINLNKHKDTLEAAWKDVLDDKSATDWALFGYEGQTNDLKVVSKGSGGIEEMTEDLNSGKIMYAYCKVLDPKTSLPKCLLINWQGEGAPLVRKGTCANHVRDVASFFKGAHVTLNARNEEEVDPQLIIDKVAKSGSAYSFKERSDHVDRVAPIGTTYKKVIPTQEINSQERDKFWEKEEKEEKQRQEEERRRKEDERSRLENERKQRELAETQLREERDQERNRNINQLREAERSAENNSLGSPPVDDELAEREREDQERRERSELLRRQRSQEAQAVISQRTFDARAVFEQNTSAGQFHNRRKASLSVGLKTEEQHPTDQPSTSVPEQLPVTPNSPEIPSVVQTCVSTAKEVPVEIPQVNNQNSLQEDLQNNGWTTNTPVTVKQPEVEDPLLFETPALGSDLGLRARALYDYQAADPTEITFDPGDIITHIDQIDEGWWQGLGPDGTFGLFPANYVELSD